MQGSGRTCRNVPGRSGSAARRLVSAAIALLLVPAFVGTRATAVQVDITGTWDFVVELDIGGGEPVFVFEQDGEELTGTYQGTFGTADVTGTVTGNRIEFRFGGEAARAVYVGTVDGDTMQGTCDYGGVGEGTWEAKRRP
ncbi:MAG: hypothetical protein F4Z04_01105 [Acidobacteria bacterium]|nr:hypothetical protein [Acidobacteriota bacterium]